MSRHRFRFCSVEAPDAWAPMAGLGAIERGSGAGLSQLEVREQWPQPETALDQLAARHQELLAAVHPDLVVIAAEPTTVGQGLPAYRLVTTRTEREPRRTTELIVARGPVVCHLAVSGPQDNAEQHDRLAAAIAATFAFERDEAVTGARQARLLAEAAAGGGAAGQVTWHELERAGAAVPLPPGWEVVDAAGTGTADAVEAVAVLATRGATIALRRPPDGDADPPAWLARRLAAARAEAGVKVLGWESGELTPERPYAGLSFSVTRSTSAWSAPAATSCLAFATGEAALLEWTLEVGRDGWYPAAAAALATMVRDFTILPGERWLTEPAEPWLELSLRGPWTSSGPGLYLKRDGAKLTTLQLLQMEVGRRLDLATIRPAMPEVLDTYRAGLPILDVLHEDEAAGMWRGVDAFRYSLDAVLRDHGRVAVRAVTVKAGETLSTCILRGPDPDEVQRLFLATLDGLALPGMERR